MSLSYFQDPERQRNIKNETGDKSASQVLVVNQPIEQ